MKFILIFSLTVLFACNKQNNIGTTMPLNSDRDKDLLVTKEDKNNLEFNIPKVALEPLKLKIKYSDQGYIKTESVDIKESLINHKMFVSNLVLKNNKKNILLNKKDVLKLTLSSPLFSQSSTKLKLLRKIKYLESKNSLSDILDLTFYFKNNFKLDGFSEIKNLNVSLFKFGETISQSEIKGNIRILNDKESKLEIRVRKEKLLELLSDQHKYFLDTQDFQYKSNNIIISNLYQLKSALEKSVLVILSTPSSFEYRFVSAQTGYKLNINNILFLLQKNASYDEYGNLKSISNLVTSTEKRESWYTYNLSEELTGSYQTEASDLVFITNSDIKSVFDAFLHEQLNDLQQITVKEVPDELKFYFNSYEGPIKIKLSPELLKMIYKEKVFTTSLIDANINRVKIKTCRYIHLIEGDWEEFEEKYSKYFDISFSLINQTTGDNILFDITKQKINKYDTWMISPISIIQTPFMLNISIKHKIINEFIDLGYLRDDCNNPNFKIDYTSKKINDFKQLKGMIEVFQMF
jgi:hypothetical protein